MNTFIDEGVLSGAVTLVGDNDKILSIQSCGHSKTEPSAWPVHGQAAIIPCRYDPRTPRGTPHPPRHGERSAVESASL